MLIKISDIKVGERRRTINPDKVKELAESIKEIGLINPITIDSDNNLIAGAHRLEAVKLLGLEEIVVNLKIGGSSDTPYYRMMEIDENLMRSELTTLERADHLAERKRLYELMHPETKQGGDRKSEEYQENKIKRKLFPFDSTNNINNHNPVKAIGNDMSEIISPTSEKDNVTEIISATSENSRQREELPQTFAKDTASKLGITERTVRQEIKIANDLTPEAKEIIRGTPIEGRKVDLIAISKLPPEQQVQAAQQITKPHIAQATGNNEWYTPAEIIEAARAVLYHIDLDPASSELANSVVKAEEYYTIEDDGLKQRWHGNIWLNPPYSSDLISLFIDKLVETYDNGDTDEAIVLVNNATETKWFRSLMYIAKMICFPFGRIKYWGPDGIPGAPLQGQAIIYIGDNRMNFRNQFSKLGWLATPG